MQTPDAAAVRAALPKFDWDGRVGPLDTVPNPDVDPVQPFVDEAVAYVQTVTWRTLDATMPSGLAAIALRAVALRAAQTSVQDDDDYVGTVNDDSIASFSIGPYSETRRDSSTLRGGRSPAQERLNAWPALEQALWLLLSLQPGETNALVDERRDYWRSMISGINAPAFSLTEVDWTNGLSGRDSYGNWGMPPGAVDLPDIY
jgi:hypothetical protein